MATVTGYTSCIIYKDADYKQYLLGCLAAFLGEDMTAENAEKIYDKRIAECQKRYDEAVKAYNDYLDLSPEEKIEKWKKEHAHDIEWHEKSIAETNENNAKFQKVLDNIKALKLPGHPNFMEFAISQIEGCIETVDYDQKRLETIMAETPDLETITAEHLDRFQWDIDHAKEYLDNANKRKVNGLALINDLLDALDKH